MTVAPAISAAPNTILRAFVSMTIWVSMTVAGPFCPVCQPSFALEFTLPCLHAEVRGLVIHWAGGLADWMGPPRDEPFVFVVSGRNVPPGRLRRCIESMARQRGPHWGVVLFDDASEPGIAEHFEIACASLGARCTVVRNRRRLGLLANMVTAVRRYCTDPETVIVTVSPLARTSAMTENTATPLPAGEGLYLPAA